MMSFSSPQALNTHLKELRTENSKKISQSINEALQENPLWLSYRKVVKLLEHFATRPEEESLFADASLVERIIEAAEPALVSQMIKWADTQQARVVLLKIFAKKDLAAKVEELWSSVSTPWGRLVGKWHEQPAIHSLMRDTHQELLRSAVRRGATLEVIDILRVFNPSLDFQTFYLALKSGDKGIITAFLRHWQLNPIDRPCHPFFSVISLQDAFGRFVFINHLEGEERVQEALPTFEEAKSFYNIFYFRNIPIERFLFKHYGFKLLDALQNDDHALSVLLDHESHDPKGAIDYIMGISDQNKKERFLLGFFNRASPSLRHELVTRCPELLPIVCRCSSAVEDPFSYWLEIDPEKLFEAVPSIVDFKNREDVLFRLASKFPSKVLDYYYERVELPIEIAKCIIACYPCLFFKNLARFNTRIVNEKKWYQIALYALEQAPQLFCKNVATFPLLQPSLIALLRRLALKSPDLFVTYHRNFGILPPGQRFEIVLSCLQVCPKTVAESIAKLSLIFEERKAIAERLLQLKGPSLEKSIPSLPEMYVAFLFPKQSQSTPPEMMRWAALVLLNGDMSQCTATPDDFLEHENVRYQEAMRLFFGEKELLLHILHFFKLSEKHLLAIFDEFYSRSTLSPLQNTDAFFQVREDFRVVLADRLFKTSSVADFVRNLPKFKLPVEKQQKFLEALMEKDPKEVLTHVDNFLLFDQEAQVEFARKFARLGLDICSRLSKFLLTEEHLLEIVKIVKIKDPHTLLQVFPRLDIRDAQKRFGLAMSLARRVPSSIGGCIGGYKLEESMRFEIAKFLASSHPEYFLQNIKNFAIEKVEYKNELAELVFKSGCERACDVIGTFYLEYGIRFKMAMLFLERNPKACLTHIGKFQLEHGEKKYIAGQFLSKPGRDPRLVRSCIPTSFDFHAICIEYLETFGTTDHKIFDELSMLHLLDYYRDATVRRKVFLRAVSENPALLDKSWEFLRGYSNPLEIFNSSRAEREPVLFFDVWCISRFEGEDRVNIRYVLDTLKQIRPFDMANGAYDLLRDEQCLPIIKYAMRGAAEFTYIHLLGALLKRLNLSDTLVGSLMDLFEINDHTLETFHMCYQQFSALLMKERFDLANDEISRRLALAWQRVEDRKLGGAVESAFAGI